MELFAYIDAGTGAFIIQTLVAVGVGIAVAFRAYWRRLFGLITGKKKNNTEGLDKSHTDDNAPVK